MSIIFEGSSLTYFYVDPPDDYTGYESYLYVVAISSGVVKVGRTTSPNVRIPSYIKSAAAYGALIEKVWVSRPGTNAKKNEASLITWCATYARSQLAREYFVGLTFSEVVKQAALLLADIPLRPRPPAGRYVAVESDQDTQTFSLAEISARTGLTLTQLTRGCRDGLFEFSLVNSRIAMTAGQIEKLVDLFLPPIEQVADTPVRTLFLTETPRRVPRFRSREAELVPIPSRLVNDPAA